MFVMVLNLRSCVKAAMCWLIMDVCDLTFIQSLSRYVVCSSCSMYSVCPVFCRCISSTFVVNKQHINCQHCLHKAQWQWQTTEIINITTRFFGRTRFLSRRCTARWNVTHGALWQVSSSSLNELPIRDVTKFEFEFDNVRTWVSKKVAPPPSKKSFAIFLLRLSGFPWNYVHLLSIYISTHVY